jgi:hypothetical protein
MKTLVACLLVKKKEKRKKKTLVACLTLADWHHIGCLDENIYNIYRFKIDPHYIVPY